MTAAAVYRFYDAQGSLLYIGATLKPRPRWLHHSYIQPWWPDVARKTIRWYQTQEAALEAEKDAIRAERPRYNIIHLRPAGPIVDMLKELGVELRTNRALIDAHLEDAREAAVAASAVGVPKRRIAKLLRVSPMTVHKWLRQAA